VSGLSRTAPRLGADRLIGSNLCLFGHFKGIIDFDPEIADDALEMAEQTEV
jgi:hypothetical protein